jgi:hypothetical protein
MGRQALDALTAVAVAIIGVAIISVLVSNQSQTSNVIKSAGSAFSGVIQAAVSPIGGGGTFNFGGGAANFPNIL